MAKRNKYAGISELPNKLLNYGSQLYQLQNYQQRLKQQQERDAYNQQMRDAAAETAQQKAQQEQQRYEWERQVEAAKLPAGSLKEEAWANIRSNRGLVPSSIASPESAQQIDRQESEVVRTPMTEAGRLGASERLADVGVYGPASEQFGNMFQIDPAKVQRGYQRQADIAKQERQTKWKKDAEANAVKSKNDVWKAFKDTSYFPSDVRDRAQTDILGFAKPNPPSDSVMRGVSWIGIERADYPDLFNTYGVNRARQGVPSFGSQEEVQRLYVPSDQLRKYKAAKKSQEFAQRLSKAWPSFMSVDAPENYSDDKMTRIVTNPPDDFYNWNGKEFRQFIHAELKKDIDDLPAVNKDVIPKEVKPGEGPPVVIDEIADTVYDEVMADSSIAPENKESEWVRRVELLGYKGKK